MSMNFRKFALAATITLTVAGCMSPQQERQTAAGVFGGAAGLVAGKIFDLDDGWLVVTTLAGAAAGTLIARNSQTNECAYADGNGGYDTRGC